MAVFGRRQHASAKKSSRRTRIKKGDRVVVMRGKDGPKFVNGKKVYKTGLVLQVFPDQQRIMVEGVNIGKKCMRPTAENRSGEIVEQTMPLHISNVMLEDPDTKQPTRVGYRHVAKADGKQRKVRYAKRSGKEITTAKWTKTRRSHT